MHNMHLYKHGQSKIQKQFEKNAALHRSEVLSETVY